MRIAPSMIAAALLGGCAHLPPPLAEPSPGEPRGFVAVETRPGGARAVVRRAGEASLACDETPCRFPMTPGPATRDRDPTEGNPCDRTERMRPDRR
jgi:hypothetical protein